MVSLAVSNHRTAVRIADDDSPGNRPPSQLLVAQMRPPRKIDGGAAVRNRRRDRGNGPYIAGPEAGFMTGASLTIDGGFNA